MAFSPFVQTPTYIRTTGSELGQALRKIGIVTDPGEVDLINPKIYIQEIQMADDYSFTTESLTGSEDVQIVAGGANPGDPYYTTLDVLAAYHDLGGFGPTPEYVPKTWQEIEAESGLIARKEVTIIETDTSETRIAAPDDYATGLNTATWTDPFTGGNVYTVVPEGFDRATVSAGGATHPDAWRLEG